MMSSLKSLAFGLLLITGTSGCCLMGPAYSGMYGGYPMGGAGCNPCMNGACGPMQGGMATTGNRTTFAQPVAGTSQLVLIDPLPAY